MVSALCSDRAKGIYGLLAAGTGAVFCLVNGVMSTTAVKTAVAYATYCPNHGEPVTTPTGLMTCGPLGRLVAREEVVLPLFSWIAPVIFFAGVGCIAHRYFSTGAISDCCRKRTFVDVSSLANDEPYYSE